VTLRRLPETVKERREKQPAFFSVAGVAALGPRRDHRKPAASGRSAWRSMANIDLRLLPITFIQELACDV
jgi:hypothetical protein